MGRRERRRGSHLSGDADPGREVDDELDFHLRQLADELRARGLPAAEARRRAEEEFGDLAATRRYCEAEDRRRVRREQCLGRARDQRQRARQQPQRTGRGRAARGRGVGRDQVHRDVPRDRDRVRGRVRQRVALAAERTARVDGAVIARASGLPAIAAPDQRAREPCRRPRRCSRRRRGSPRSGRRRRRARRARGCPGAGRPPCRGRG